MKSVMISCVALSLIAAMVYFLMGANVITVPGINSDNAPAGIVYAAGGGYVLGALLILLRKRWLWVTGLVINTLVVVVFYSMYNQNPDIMFSLAGLGTKIAQILLEVGLILIIATYGSNPGTLKPAASRA
jgi:hypothetical protein